MGFLQSLGGLSYALVALALVWLAANAIYALNRRRLEEAGLKIYYGVFAVYRRSLRAEAPRPRRGARALDVASCLALAATMAFSYYVLASSFISRLLGTVALRV
ncbi:MAG: hypothetical protein ABWK00_00815, partial [Desulfurococcaceae archaeon]